MSGLLSGLGSIAGIGETVTSIIAPNLRYMVWPLGTVGDALNSDLGQALGLGNIGSSLGLSDSVTSALSALVIPQILTGYVQILESHKDDLTITDHPVEQGATITDHAYQMPAMLSLRLGWSTSQPSSSVSGINNILTSAAGLLTGALTLPVLAGFFNSASDAFINNIYNTLLTVQANRSLITVATARRLYSNMLLQTISLETDEKSEHALVVTAIMKQIILVSAQVVSTPVNSSSNANQPALNPTQPQGQQSLTPTGASVLPPGATT